MHEAKEKAWPVLETPTRVLALISCALGILVVTLFPVRAGLAEGLRSGHWPHGAVAKLLERTELVGVGDLFWNVILFLPIGFFATSHQAALAKRGRLTAFLAGVLLSALIEVLQAAVPGRWPSLFDIASNGAGAWFGSLLLGWAARRERPLADL